MSETLRDDARGEPRHLPQRADPELLEELGQRLELEAGAQQRDRQRSEEAAQVPLLHDMETSLRVRPSRTLAPARRCASGQAGRLRPATTLPRPHLQCRGVGREAARRRTEAGAGTQLPARGREHAGEIAAVEPAQPTRLEVGRPRAIGLDLGSDRLEAVEHGVPQRAHPLGVGRHEPQGRAARHGLPQSHPPHDPERLGRGGHLPHHLLASRLRGQRGRLGEQCAPISESRQELEAGVEDANDHDRTHVRISLGGMQASVSSAIPPSRPRCSPARWPPRARARR